MRNLSIAIFITALVIGLIFWLFHSSSQDVFEKQALKHEFVVVQAHELLGFNLVDPEQAPPAMRESVMRGYRVVMDTPYYAKGYARDQLSCANCHFSGGDTLGGKNGGISLVGVITRYPKEGMTLAERINYCFERSLNGKPIPIDSQMMRDIIMYLTWISKEVVALKHIPWLGLTEIKSSHQPDAHNGKKIYNQYCLACHQADGQGGGVLGKVEGKTIPPLWGEESFNKGAGMNTMKFLAPFIYFNMPYQDAALTKDEALDVAAYILEQPRSNYSPKQKL